MGIGRTLIKYNDNNNGYNKVRLNVNNIISNKTDSEYSVESILRFVSCTIYHIHYLYPLFDAFGQSSQKGYRKVTYLVNLISY